MKHYECDTIIIRCTDYKINTCVQNWIDESKLRCDVFAVHGGAKALISSSVEVTDYILRQIQLSIALHKAKEIILMYHFNCDAYRFYLCASEREEFFLQDKTITAAEEILKEYFGESIKIRKIWIGSKITNNSVTAF